MEKKPLELLGRAEEGRHIVQIYKREDYLAASVAEYIGRAMERKEAVIIIATPQHHALFARHLDAETLQAHRAAGMFTALDAEHTLSLFMRDGRPDWKLFKTTIGGLLDEIGMAHPFVRISAYGEMVNILWQEGNKAAAIELEEHWNKLAKIHSFSLLCAYYLRSEEDQMEGQKLKDICRTHSHFIPSEASPRLEKAISAAIERSLGSKSLIMRTLIEMLARREKMAPTIPDHLSALMWLEDNMPQTAAEVKMLTRQFLAES